VLKINFYHTVPGRFESWNLRRAAVNLRGLSFAITLVSIMFPARPIKFRYSAWQPLRQLKQ